MDAHSLGRGPRAPMNNNMGPINEELHCIPDS